MQRCVGGGCGEKGGVARVQPPAATDLSKALLFTKSAIFLRTFQILGLLLKRVEDKIFGDLGDLTQQFVEWQVSCVRICHTCQLRKIANDV